MSESTERAVLMQAAEHVTLTELALWLGAPVKSLEEWMRGVADMPKRKFQLLVDLLDKLGEPPIAVLTAPSPNNVVQLRRHVR